MKPTSACACLLILAGFGADAPAGEVEIREWEVPVRMDADGTLHDELPSSFQERTRPRDPYVDGQGRVWFCGQAGNYLGYLDPETGRFKRYTVDEGTHPHNLIIDDADQIWYAGNKNSHIGRLDPETGKIVKVMMPDPDVTDPHTLIWDREGNIWFTAQWSNAIGRLTVASGEIDIVKVPTPKARPYGIVIGPGNRPWIVLFGTNAIATVDPGTMKLETYPLPQAEARPRRLEVTSDGMVWYVDYRLGLLGRLDPDTGEVATWPAPSGEGSLPYAMAVDDKDRLWFVESPKGVSRLVGFDPGSEEYFSITPLPSGGQTVRHMIFHGPTRTIWFGADSNTIGRARL